jgi:hypothetical protein
MGTEEESGSDGGRQPASGTDRFSVRQSVCLGRDCAPGRREHQRSQLADDPQQLRCAVHRRERDAAAHGRSAPGTQSPRTSKGTSSTSNASPVRASTNRACSVTRRS